MPRFTLLTRLSQTALGIASLSVTASAITISIDYTYDTNDFFAIGSGAADPNRRARLEDAATFLGDLLVDDLDAIEPPGHWGQGDGEAWQAVFENPSGSGTITVNDLVVAADEVIIFAGSESFFGTELGEAGFGGANLFTFPNSTFDTAIKTRGESGVGTTDFAPWGGYLTLDNTTTWDSSLIGGGGGQHLYSTLLHEVAHVLGFGVADSWDAQVDGSGFTGTEAVAEHGGPVPVSPEGDHLATGTSSFIRGTSTPQEAALDPNISPGQVKLFTDLDTAVLDDIGWDIAPVPEPSQTLLLAVAALGFLRRRR